MEVTFTELLARHVYCPASFLFILLIIYIIIILATGKFAHKLNCNAEPKPRESRASSGSPSLG